MIGIFRIMSEIDNDYPKMVFPDGWPDPFVSYIECPKCGKNLCFHIVDPKGAFPMIFAFCPGSCRVNGRMLLYGVRYTSVDDIPRAVNYLRDRIAENIDKIETVE